MLYFGGLVLLRRQYKQEADSRKGITRGDDDTEHINMTDKVQHKFRV